MKKRSATTLGYANVDSLLENCQRRKRILPSSQLLKIQWIKAIISGCTVAQTGEALTLGFKIELPLQKKVKKN